MPAAVWISQYYPKAPLPEASIIHRAIHLLHLLPPQWYSRIISKFSRTTPASRLYAASLRACVSPERSRGAKPLRCRNVGKKTPIGIVVKDTVQIGAKNQTGGSQRSIRAGCLLTGTFFNLKCSFCPCSKFRTPHMNFIALQLQTAGFDAQKAVGQTTSANFAGSFFRHKGRCCIQSPSPGVSSWSDSVCSGSKTV